MTFLKKKIFMICIFSIFVLGFSEICFAFQKDSSLILSLPQALKIALTQHADVIVANERVNQALAQIQENSSALFPQLKGTVSETRRTQDIRSTGINFPGSPLVGPFNVYDARLRLTQTIFDPGMMSRLKSSEQKQVLSLAQQQQVKQDVLVLAATLFIQAKRAQESCRFDQAVLRREQKEMNIVFARLKSGISSALDMQKARAKYAHALYQYQVTKRQALESRLDLIAALNLPMEQEFDFVWGKQDPFEDLALESFEDNQLDINLAREQLKLSQRDQVVISRDFWPKVSISGDYGSSGESPSSRDSSETYALGITASIPLFEGGLRQAKLKESESAVRISQIQLQNVERHVKAKFAGQHAILAQANSFVQESQRNIVVALAELRLVRSKYQSGIGSSLDVTSAEVRALAAEDQKDESQAYYFLTRIHLARLLGRVEQFLLDDKL
ncbi:MAG: TolC family protein [Candidatus Omnitrophica bacterium]|nr:TolC family protein [Candidatus Omnitrophota bacterium]